jgi:integrase
MSRRVQSLFESLRDNATNTEYVFRSIRTGLKITEIKRGFTSACTEAGVHNLTFHDLRHTWSTRAADCGVIHAVRRDILGHSSVTMTDDYTQSTPEARERAMEAVASYGRQNVFQHGKITAEAKNEGDQATALSL